MKPTVDVPSKVARHRDTDVTISISKKASLQVRRVYLRLATRRKTNHDDGNTTGMEEPTGHSAVKLGRSHVLVLGDIMDAVDESRALATVSRRVGRNLGSTGRY